MIDFYFITGFLGSGKTTFIKNFVQFFENKKIAIIVNEFGKTGVDGSLLSQLNAEISEINNGSILCSCRIFDFKETLKNTLKKEPSIIIVEASGLTDPTTIKKFLCNKEFSTKITYKGCICLIDACNFEKVLHTALVCKKQLLVSDVAIINKIDLVTENKKNEITQTIKNICPNIGTTYSQFSAVDKSLFTLLEESQNIDKESFNDSNIAADITLKKYQLTITKTISLKQLEKLVELLSCESYRIKGFITLHDKNYIIDCVQSIVSISLYEGSIDPTLFQKIVILAGKGMKTSSVISQAKNLYSEYIQDVE